MQGGYDHAPGLSGHAGLSLIIDDLHQQRFGLHMQRAVFKTAEGDVTDLVGRVDVGTPDLPLLGQTRFQRLVQRLGDKADLAQGLRTVAGIGHAVHEPGHDARIGQQVMRIEVLEPRGQFSDGSPDAYCRRGPAREQVRNRRPPVGLDLVDGIARFLARPDDPEPLAEVAL